jgi:hypothetical protein
MQWLDSQEPKEHAMKTTTILAGLALALVGCGGTTADDAEELGHAAADALASFDESGTGGGFAWMRLPLDRPGLDRSLLDRALELAAPQAWAAACWSEHFGTCEAGVRVKDFGDCALGANKLSGDVTLTFSDSNCSMAGVGASVTRTAQFTLTGRRNATLSVSSEGGGQKVTRTADGYTYEVLGMQRVAKRASNETLFDISTRTIEPLVVTGTTRRERTLVSGKLEISHNLAHYKTTLVPENVTWDGACNCPVSGKLSGTATGLKNGDKSAVVEFTGCGTGTVTIGSESQSVSFDRCTTL